MPGRRRPLLAGTAGPRGPKGALLSGRPSSVWPLPGSRQRAPAPLRWAGLGWTDRGRRALHGDELRAPRGSGSGERGCPAGWGSERRPPTPRRGCGLPGDMCLCFFLSQLLGTERLLASGGRRVLPGRSFAVDREGVGAGGGRSWLPCSEAGSSRTISLKTLPPPVWVSDGTRAKFDPALWLALSALLGKLLVGGGSFFFPLPVNHFPVFISLSHFYPLVNFVFRLINSTNMHTAP